MDKGRLEAFSDGVLAVAITLLVLDLHIDTDRGHAGIGRQLGEHWPSYVAYVMSFFIIGVIWVNHHALLDLAARVDRQLLYLNLLLMMFVCTIPFTTATLAGSLREGGGAARWGVLLYGISAEGMAIAFTLMLRRMLFHGLVRIPVTPVVAGRAMRRFGIGTLLYPAITALGLLWAPIMIIAYLVLTGYYIVEQTPILPAQVEAD